MTGATRGYRGISAEQRRAHRRAALLEAAMDLIAEAGPTAVTKHAVCARARLNDRYFYEHFTDRDALLEALAQEQTALGVQVVVTAVLAADTSSLAHVVHAAADSALAVLEADPRRTALLLASHDSEVVSRARQQTQHAIASAMAAVTRELLGEDAPAPLDLDMIAYTVVSGTLELVTAWLRGDFTTSREHLTDLIAATLLASTTITNQTDPARPRSRR
jgi:AcrR family transcriptional regulator